MYLMITHHTSPTNSQLCNSFDRLASDDTHKCPTSMGDQTKSSSQFSYVGPTFLATQKIAANLAEFMDTNIYT